MSKPEPEGIAVPVSWVIGDDLPVHMTNQFLGQAAGPDEIVVTFGQLIPPPLIGESEDDRRTQLEAISFVPIQALARFSMNRRRLEELRGVIDKTLQNHDTLFGRE